MKTTTQLDDQIITNDVHYDAEGLPLYEEVTCETGSFPVLRLASSDGVLVDANTRD
jgi:hypothetical protein